MNLNDYQKQAKETAVFPAEVSAAYVALGVVGEAGEVAEEVKKCLRRGYNPDGSDFPEDRRENLFEEIGDVLWYLANLADILGFDLSEIASANIDKLQKRYNK